MKLTESLSEFLGFSTDCSVPNCKGRVHVEKLGEFNPLVPGICEEGRPWIADAPGSQTGYIVCREHNYDGEYVFD